MIDRDQPDVHERLDVVVRCTRRELRPQDPNELVGLRRREPFEPRRRMALFQQGKRDEIERLGLVRAIGDQKDGIDVPVPAVLEELFRVMRSNPSIRSTICPV
jgi:hypothetical protein